MIVLNFRSAKSVWELTLFSFLGSWPLSDLILSPYGKEYPRFFGEGGFPFYLKGRNSVSASIQHPSNTPILMDIIKEIKEKAKNMGEFRPGRCFFIRNDFTYL